MEKTKNDLNDLQALFLCLRRLTFNGSMPNNMLTVPISIAIFEKLHGKGLKTKKDSFSILTLLF